MPAVHPNREHRVTASASAVVQVVAATKVSSQVSLVPSAGASVVAQDVAATKVSSPGNQVPSAEISQEVHRGRKDLWILARICRSGPSLTK